MGYLSNFTALDNMTDPALLFTATNTASGGYVGYMMLFIVFIVSFLIFKSTDFRTRFLLSSFFTYVIALILAVLQMLPITIFGILTLIFVLALVLRIVENN